MNNISFTGIKLSDPRLESVRDIVFHLEKTGYNSFGKQHKYINNTTIDKIELFKAIRNENDFRDRDFGTVFLPWSNEAYIIAQPTYEQLMLPAIRQYDKKACINLLL